MRNGSSRPPSHPSQGSGPSAAADRPALWRRRTFAIYWTGGLISNIGTWLQNVTASVVVLEITGSPLMVGVLNFATFAPIFALSMFGGMLSDRYDRRTVVLCTQGISLVLSAALTVLQMTGTLGAVGLIALSALLGCSYALAKPALSALLPALVDPDEIAHATAVNTLQFNFGQVGGSALSALLLAVTNPSFAFALNTLSFLGPIASMMALRSVVLPDRKGRSSLRGSGRAGLRFVLGSRPMVAMLVAIPLSNAAVEGLRTLAPDLVARLPGLTSAAAGALVTSYSLGATAGLLCFGVVARRFAPGRILLVAFALQAAGLLAVPLGLALWPAIVGAVPIGIGFALNIPVLSAGLQVLSSDDFRGRVMSMFSMVHLGLRPIFSLLAGALASWWDPRWALMSFVAFPVLALVFTAPAGRAIAELRSASDAGRPRAAATEPSDLTNLSDNEPLSASPPDARPTVDKKEFRTR